MSKKRKNNNAKASKAKAVAKAVKQAGNKVTKSDVKKMEAKGFAAKQIKKVAAKVGNVGSKAQRRIDNKHSSNSKGGNSSGGGGGGSAPSVRQAVQQAGNKLTRGDVKGLEQQGMGSKKIGKVAERHGNVGQKAVNRLDNRHGISGIQASAGRQQQSSPARTTSSSSAPARPQPSSFSPQPSGSSSPAPAVKPRTPSQNYGTSDMGGWLASELSAIDTFKPDTAPKVFNSYRPTELSGQLRDAVSEANRFIDEHSAQWRSK